MKQKRVVDKDCCYKGFKFKEKHHSTLVRRRNLLGQSIEWQVNEATKEFTENHAHELAGKEKKEIVYRYRTFKFKKKSHEILALRRDFLGQIIEWQLNKAVEEYLKKHSKELEEKEKAKEKEIREEEKAITETKKKDENPKQEPENKPEVTL